MNIIYHYLLWVSISYSSTVNCIDDQLIAWGCFLSVKLYHISFLSFSMASMTGGLISSIRLSELVANRSRAAAFFLPVTFLGTALADGVLCGGSCHGLKGVNGCSWGAGKLTSMVCFSGVDSLGREHGWPCQHTSQLLWIQQHNRYD